MIRTAGNDLEYFDTLFKYWGRWAYYLGIISTLLIIFAASCAYFIIMSQMLYPIALALIEWIFKKQIELVDKPVFTSFSQAYCAIVLFVVEIFIVTKKDLSIFIKLVSYGSFFIMSLMVFIVGVGFYSLHNTHFEIVNHNQPTVIDGSRTRNIHLFDIQVSPLAGLLGIGFFLHTISIPIIRNNANQKNNERDVLLGYILVATSYIVVGTMGYIGFTGYFFTEQYKVKDIK